MKQSRHAIQRDAIRTRANAALAGMYHNATITYPRDLCGRSDEYFENWLRDLCEQETDYIRSGGAYGSNYHATLAAPCNAGKYKSERAQARYIAKGMCAMRAERDDCGMLTGWRVLELAAGNTRLARRLKKYDPLTRNNSRWEYVSEYGDLYQYGRGGRTLAPKDLVRTGGGSSFSCKENADELRIDACMRLIYVIESFNAHVSSWCASIPQQWSAHCAEQDADAKHAKRAAIVRKARETRERNHWAARGMVTA